MLLEPDQGVDDAIAHHDVRLQGTVEVGLAGAVGVSGGFGHGDEFGLGDAGDGGLGGVGIGADDVHITTEHFTANIPVNGREFIDHMGLLEGRRLELGVEGETRGLVVGEVFAGKNGGVEEGLRGLLATSLHLALPASLVAPLDFAPLILAWLAFSSLVIIVP